MEKSIETIWKEGFLSSDALIAPKVNDLYNKKSVHIVDKFTRMFKVNLIGIVAFSIFILPASYLVKIPYLGIGMFIILNILVVINYKLLKGLEKIDKNVNSYQYLTSFDKWMKEQITINTKIARVMYPWVFLSMVAGFWFGPFGGDVPGDKLVTELLIQFPDMVVVFGFPLYGLIGAFIIILLLAYFAGRIYRFDLNLVYGRVLKKLEEIITDIESLKATD
ncbi:MAG: hypothetical protein ACI83W_001089 [Marinoscillum sp.]|jgi:hypothetical protein